MMKLIQVLSAEPRPPFSGFEATRAVASLSPRSKGVFCSRTPSVRGICRIIKPDKVAVNSMIVSLSGSCHVSRINTVCHRAKSFFSSRKRLRNRKRGAFTTASALSPSNFPVEDPGTPLSVSANLLSSEAPQRSDEWFLLRKDKLTTSTFSTALGFWKGNRRFELWHQKVYDSDSEVVQSSARFAMDWGVLNEAAAVDRYKSITGREVSSLSFAIHSKEQYHWLGASPDGLLDSFGILEVKCPYNKGKTETAMPWKTMPFYYMPQIQGQMEIMDRDWVDLYCWTPNGSTIFHVKRERGYWDLIYGILREFWWENVVPAREALLSGNVKDASLYKPTSTHRQTGLAIAKSIRLAGEAKLLCRETAGNVEFYK